MKRLFIFFLWLLPSVGAQSALVESPIDLRAIGDVLGYPAGAMEIEDITSDHQFVHGSNIIRAFRINGKAPSTFFPIIIAIANEGTLLNEETQADISDI